MRVDARMPSGDASRVRLRDAAASRAHRAADRRRSCASISGGSAAARMRSANCAIELEGEVILPISELNRLRRELVVRTRRRARSARAPKSSHCTWREVFARAIRDSRAHADARRARPRLCASSAARMEQLDAALACGRARALRRFRGHPPLHGRRRARARARQRRADFPRHAAHPEGGRAGLLQAHRERRARRRAHPQPRRDRLISASTRRCAESATFRSTSPIR